MRKAAAALLGLVAWHGSHAQTPSPLAEWQYSAGRALEPYFVSPIPEWQGMAGLAAETAPRYEGARSYEAAGGPVAELRYRDVAFASSVEGLGVNLLHGKGYRAGLALTYDLGRDEDTDAALAGLGDLRPAPEIKGFGEYVLYPLVGRLDVRRAIGGHGGWTADAGAYVPVVGKDDFFVMLGPSVTWIDAENMRQSFGVDSRQAAQSGYAAYRPSAGVRDARFGTTAVWLFAESWMLNFSGAAEWLLGDAADSPIARAHRQFVASLLLAYRW